MTPEQPALGRSRAILIGTGAYEDEGLADLPAAVNSLKAMREVLTDPELCGWPEERVTTILDPPAVPVLVPELRRLARTVEDVLLVYFVGHGLTLPSGGLCLTLPGTVLGENVDVTSLEYSRLREVLLDSRARVKIVILDCCYSGRAIEALAPADVASATRVRGTYTLTASDQAAHVVPLAEQAETATSFTRELLGLVRDGVPGGPERLTLTGLFPHLWGRLDDLGLPEPNQRNAETAEHFPFTRNAAYAHPSDSPYVVRLNELTAACGWEDAPARLAEALGRPLAEVADYLLGWRTAPREFLDGFLGVLDAEGHGPDEEARAALHVLRREAQRVSPLPAERIVHLEETIQELRLMVGDLTGRLEDEQHVRVAEQTLAAREAARIAGLLAAAEAERSALQAQAEAAGRIPAGRQPAGRQPEAAPPGTRVVEEALDESRSDLGEVTRELRVLRGRIQRLMEPGKAGQVAADDQEGMVRLLERALELAPGDAGLRRDLGASYAQWARKVSNETGDYARAVGLLRRSLALAPGDPTASEFLDAALSNRAGQLCGPGASDEELTEAVELWKELIALKGGLDHAPDHASGYAYAMRRLARSSALADEHERALGRMAVALWADPEFTGDARREAPRRVAVMLANHVVDDLDGRPFPERAELLRRALSYEDGDDLHKVMVSLWRSEATAHYGARRYAEAVRLLEEALDLARSDRARARLHQELGVVYSSFAIARANRNELGEARVLIGKAAGHCPGDPQITGLRERIEARS